MNYDLINSNSIDFNQKIDEKIKQNDSGKGHGLKRGISKYKIERQHREVEQDERDTEYYKNRKDEEVHKVVHFKTLTKDNELQFESMQSQLETVKNKHNKMSKTIDRFERKKLPKLKDEFYDIKNRTAEEKTKFKTLKQDIDQSEHKLKDLNADINHK